MSDCDSRYHRLFSLPRMVEELVREIGPEALATGLDFSGLQRVNPKFHIGRRSARRRESDVIWRLPTRGGSDVYLYLLLEFQSKSDWRMAVRAQVYQGLLWEQVIAEKELKSGSRLPPLLLLVLYNGVSRWKAPTEVRELIALSRDSPLWPSQPQVRYHLLEMSAFRRKKMAGQNSLVRLLFRLEGRPSSEELAELIDEVVDWFRQHPDETDLKQLFTELVGRAYIESGVTGPIPEDLLEMKTNLEGLTKIWKKQWRAEGLAEGRAKGLVKGKAEALVCLLAERFGAVTPSLCERIHAANLATLDRWFKRAIAAPDLPSVFT